MKKFSLLVIAFLLLGSSAWAFPPIVGGGGAGVLTASNCDQAAYYPIGKLCQDTDDGKLYKGTGSGVEVVTSGLSYTASEINSRLGQTFLLSDYGAVCNNSTDDTTALNNALAAWYAAGGGTIVVDGSNLCKIAGQITVPNSLGTTAATLRGDANGDGANPSQPFLRITGKVGAPVNGRWGALPTPVNGFNFSYNVGDYGAFNSLGHGKLEIDHLVLLSSDADGGGILYWNNTTVHVHDNTFIGAGAGGTASVTTAIYTGWGTYTTGGAPGNAFQGYGSMIERNWFDKVACAVNAQAASNNLVIKNNVVSLTSGNTTNAAFITYLCTGVSFIENLIEVYNFKYGIYLLGNDNYVNGNNCWDHHVGVTTACVNIDSGSVGNLVFVPHSDTTYFVDNATDKSSNRIVTNVYDSYLPSGTTGRYRRNVAEATADIEGDASTTITLNIPSGAVLKGCQFRVDAALAATETWDAAFSGGSTANLVTAAAVAKNTKVNKAIVPAIASDVTNIAITKNGGGSFTAQGTIRAICYYDDFVAMADAP